MGNKELIEKLYSIFADIMDLADYDRLEQNEIGGGYKTYRDIYLQELYDNKISSKDIDFAFDNGDLFMERYEAENNNGETYDMDYIVDLVESYKFGKMRDKDLISELKSYLF